MSTRRILRLTRRLPPFPGGQEIHVFELSRRQVRAGDSVELWYAEGNDIPDGAVAHRVPMNVPGIRASNLAATASYARRAAREMRRRPADLVHVHGDFLEAWYGARVARSLGTPLVMTVHAGLNQRYAHATRIAIKHVDHFFALGSRVAADLGRCGVDDDRMTVMSSGLDYDLLGPYLHRGLTERPRVVSVGALDSMKNHETVLAAAEIVRQTYPDLEVFIVGEGRERARLEALIAGTTGVHLTGQLPRPEVYDLVSQASVFTLASRRLAGKAEGVPTALLEAMALARPCVVSSACTPDAIVGRDAGAYITADPESPESFAAGMCEALDDTAAARAMGKHAAAAVANLGWDAIVERVNTVYDSLLAEHAERR
jgi:glycosyltransferase involved in cell wall biosynthesis